MVLIFQNKVRGSESSDTRGQGGGGQKFADVLYGSPLT